MPGNVWVTGSSGFIGSALIRSLAARGMTARCVTNSQSPCNGAVPADYGSRESIRSAVAREGVPDVLFHLGWGDVYEPQSLAHLGENLIGTKTLLETLYESGLKKAILIGSSSEYGSREGSLSEDDPPIGRLTPYAQGKIQACAYGHEAASRHGTVFLHIRLFHTLGAGKRENSLINQLYRAYRSSTALGLSSCEQFRDYIYLSDAVEGIIRISGMDSSETVNLGSGRQIQLKDLIQRFWVKLGAPPELLRFGAHERPLHEPVQPLCCANPAKLRRLTGWEPEVAIDEAISRTIEELRSRN